MNDNYTLNDEGELVLDESAKKNSAKWKKIAIITIALCIALFILIIIILLISKGGNGGGGESEKKNSVGEIICMFEIENSEKETQILSSEYNLQNKNFDVSVNNKIINDFSGSIKFNITGYQKVVFILYGDINMEKMFKEIESLISVEMATNSNTKIVAIESAFESCTNFNFFNMTGFDTSQLMSLRKLFYNTDIDSDTLNSFNIDTKNIQDFSFLFSGSKLTYIDLSKIQTTRAHKYVSYVRGV